MPSEQGAGRVAELHQVQLAAKRDVDTNEWSLCFLFYGRTIPIATGVTASNPDDALQQIAATLVEKLSERS